MVFPSTALHYTHVVVLFCGPGSPCNNIAVGESPRSAVHHQLQNSPRPLQESSLPSASLGAGTGIPWVRFSDLIILSRVGVEE